MRPVAGLPRLRAATLDVFYFHDGPGRAGDAHRPISYYKAITTQRASAARRSRGPKSCGRAPRCCAIEAASVAPATKRSGPHLAMIALERSAMRARRV